VSYTKSRQTCKTESNSIDPLIIHTIPEAPENVREKMKKSTPSKNIETAMPSVHVFLSHEKKS
jgi:hypothetical protein